MPVDIRPAGRTFRIWQFRPLEPGENAENAILLFPHKNSLGVLKVYRTETRKTRENSENADGKKHGKCR